MFIPNSLAQEDTQIPSWIKNVSGWWANDEIPEKSFLTAIQYLINNNIISLSTMPCGTLGSSSTEMVPSWVKNNAKWWSEDLIEDTDFINGIEYLIKKQIISIDNKKITSKVPIEDIYFSPLWDVDRSNLVFVESSFFEFYADQGDCVVGSDGNPLWRSLFVGLDPSKMNMYNDVAIWNEPQNTVVVYPYLTFIAYADQGFYDYFAGICDSCTTTKYVDPRPLYTSSGIGIQALTLLGYPTINDIQIDKDPSILQQFDKVIMLHSEYVTRTMFDAITSHPNVIYLYPNALYAEIEINYTDDTITLIRGHNYPEPEITNGFGWEFDNTHPYEFDSDCLDMEFYKIENGWMTNCYPENVFVTSGSNVSTLVLKSLLQIIKDL
jgi:hypothetical protein